MLPRDWEQTMSLKYFQENKYSQVDPMYFNYILALSLYTIYHAKIPIIPMLFYQSQESRCKAYIPSPQPVPHKKVNKISEYSNNIFKKKQNNQKKTIEKKQAEDVEKQNDELETTKESAKPIISQPEILKEDENANNPQEDDKVQHFQIKEQEVKVVKRQTKQFQLNYIPEVPIVKSQSIDDSPKKVIEDYDNVFQNDEQIMEKANEINEQFILLERQMQKDKIEKIETLEIKENNKKTDKQQNIKNDKLDKNIINRNDKNEITDKTDKADKTEKNDKIDKTGKVDKTDKNDKTYDKTDKTHNTEKINKTEKNDKNDKNDKTIINRNDKNDQNDKNDRNNEKNKNDKNNEKYQKEAEKKKITKIENKKTETQPIIEKPKINNNVNDKPQTSDQKNKNQNQIDQKVTYQNKQEVKVDVQKDNKNARYISQNSGENFEKYNIMRTPQKQSMGYCNQMSQTSPRRTKEKQEIKMQLTEKKHDKNKSLSSLSMSEFDRELNYSYDTAVKEEKKEGEKQAELVEFVYKFCEELQVWKNSLLIKKTVFLLYKMLAQKFQRDERVAGRLKEMYYSLLYCNELYLMMKNDKRFEVLFDYFVQDECCSFYSIVQFYLVEIMRLIQKENQGQLKARVVQLYELVSANSKGHFTSEVRRGLSSEFVSRRMAELAA